ncbi:MAG: hypothetical protein ACP5H8_03905 [Candidatus Micrarchaeia archaeon]
MHALALMQDELTQFDVLIRESGATKLKKTNRYEYSRYKLDALSIILYSSGKVVFSEYPKELERQITSFFMNNDKCEYPTIGSDEAGKGEAIGPVIVSAVLLRDKRERALARMYGAMDSKQMSSVQINAVYNRVKHFTHSTRMLSPSDFNRVFSNNLNELLCSLHLSSLQEVLKKVSGKCIVYVDKFGGKGHDEYIRKEILGINPEADVSVLTMAEKYPSVACASIISKHEYERWLDSYADELGIDDIRKIDISKLGTNILGKIAKVKYLK